jgi:hypothetical protein
MVRVKKNEKNKMGFLRTKGVHALCPPPRGSFGPGFASASFERRILEINDLFYMKKYAVPFWCRKYPKWSP